MENTNTCCTECNHEVLTENSILQESGGRVCNQCLRFLDMEAMDHNGKAVLYYVHDENQKPWVANFVCTLAYEISKIKVTDKRVDMWFTDHNGVTWWGVNYPNSGDHVTCRRLRSSMN